MCAKVIAQTTIVGQQGVNLIERIVMNMGFVWYPTGSVEAGIDGHIEIRDPQSGAVSNSFIAVQSKAIGREFSNETSLGFDYYCSQKDLEYWLGGNLPVILVVSRPSTDEAYWVSIKDYFGDPARRQVRKVHFDKMKDRFCASCARALIDMAIPAGVGLYLAPYPSSEPLISNLLPVAFFSSRLFSADTRFRQPGELWQEARVQGVGIGGEWILRHGRIFSFCDLTRTEWRSLCDQGTVEDYVVDEWAQSDDHERRREFVELLRRALSAMLRPVITYEPKQRLYYFRATPNLSPRTVTYRSLNKNTDREVFGPHLNKKGYVSYYRHSAFEERFHRFGDKWYLEISPTYHFTSDGHQPSRMAESLLRGIKKIEKHEAVRGQVLMWASVLTPRADLLSDDPYPYLGFWDLLTLEADRSIPDDEWKANRDSVKESDTNSTTPTDEPQQVELFVP